MEPTGLAITHRNLLVDGYESGFGPPRVSQSGFWTRQEPNRTVFAVQNRTSAMLPGHVANTSLDEDFKTVDFEGGATAAETLSIG